MFEVVSSRLKERAIEQMRLRHDPYCKRCMSKNRLGYASTFHNNEPICAECLAWLTVRPVIIKGVIQIAVGVCGLITLLIIVL